LSDCPIQVQTFEHYQGLSLPAYQTEQAAGADLLAAIDTNICLKPGERSMIPTGIAIALPLGFEAQVRPRSGLATKFGVTLLNSPGTIDADYRGEIKVIMINLGTEDFVISRGMRVAQMIIAQVSRAVWQPVVELPSTERSSGGFGHTGV